MGLVPLREKEERSWSMHPEPQQEGSFYFYYVFMEKLQFSDMSVHLGVCLYVISHLVPPCHSFSKSQLMHEGHACELLQFKLPAMSKLHSCIFHCCYTDGLPSVPNV